MKVHEFKKKVPMTAELKDKIERLRTLERGRVASRAFETCGHCGEELNFQHKRDPKSRLLMEASLCTACGARSPVRLYRVQ